MKFDPTAVTLDSGHVWQRNAEGVWREWYLRKLSNGQMYWSLLTTVTPGQSVCFNCLGHDVKLVGPYQVFCNDCRQEFRTLPSTGE